LNKSHNLFFEPLNDSNKKEWNSFVFKHYDSEIFHLAEWASIYAEAYNYLPYYYLVKDNNSTIGILPLIHQKGLFKNILATPPCGLLINDIENYKQNIYKFCLEIKTRVKASDLALYNYYSISPDMITSTENARLIKLLPENLEDLDKDIGKKHRRNIKIASKYGLNHNIYNPDIEIVNAFYKLYASNYRDLGTPVNSKKFFLKQVEYLYDYIKILVVKKNRMPIGAMWLFVFKDQILSNEAATRRRYFHTRVNDYRFYHAFKFAIENSFYIYNMGRSQKNTGAYFFKKSWGCCDEQDYPVHRLSNQTGIQEKRKKYNHIIKIWQKSPVFFTNTIGPFIRKNFVLD